MQIKPIPIGLIIVGLGMTVGAFGDAWNYVRRDPLWAFQNWRFVIRSSVKWLVAGLVALGAGIVGLFL